MARGIVGGADQADTSKPTVATSDELVGGDYDGQKMAVSLLATGPDTAPVVVEPGAGLPVTLDAASLAALESITAVISGAVALDAPTLAALETIGLDAATLAALESITIGTALPAGNNNIGDVDVATLPALPAGTNAIGKLAANSGVDIGDVDVTSSALPTGAATSANQATELTDLGGVTEAAPGTDTGSSGLNGRLQRIAQRLTSLIALLPTALGAGGGLKVDGSGTALPVSGTVTANAGSGTHVVAGDVAGDAVDSGNPVKIGGIASVGFPALVAEGDRVSAWLSRSGATAIALGTYIGTGDARVSSYAASVNPVDPGVYADITVEPFLFNGATWDKQRTPKVFKTRADASITAATPATIWTPTSGKKFRLMGLSLSVAVAGQIIIKDTTATEILRSPQLPAGGVWSPTDLGNGLLSAAANNVLAIDVTATGNVGGSVWGTEE